jgi:hypothetical protein
MKLKKIITKSIRSYYDGELPMTTIEASGKPFIYTMEFFDMLAEQDLEVGEADAEQE